MMHAQVEAVLAPTDHEITALLDAWSAGDKDALGQLMEVVQDELRRTAAAYLRRERPGHTLQPTALISEIYLKLAGQEQVCFKDRKEFFGVVAKLMRRILVDSARRHGAAKRGGGTIRFSLDSNLELPSALAPDFLALNEALIDLERQSSRQCRIVEYKVWLGLKIEEIAALERVSRATVSRDWWAARLFLLRHLFDRGEVA